jgi:hypothetical protein
MSFMKNNDTMYAYSSDSYATTGDSSYWAPGTEYIYSLELQNTTTFESGSFFGGLEFNSGFLAEIIFLDDSTTLTAAQINMMRDELERVHDIY